MGVVPDGFYFKNRGIGDLYPFFFNDSESGSKVGYSLNIFSQVSVTLEYVGREKYENWGRGRSGI